ncbi:aldehyde dehydrogenase family protein [Streptomyces sp. Agncl-13]|uniref:aldehyde dehydrogenase family protein n=1 Tax=Streptomyces sp. Agncl-13 TaxID=3400628 RepID=UPI003A8A3EF4
MAADEFTQIANTLFRDTRLSFKAKGLFGLLRRDQQVRHGRRDGARLLAGQAPTGAGYFFPPTIVDGAVDGDGIVDEEQFGPVLPVVPYTDIEDALARANGTTYGLSGSVWGTDTDRASAVAARLECGTAWVNTHFALGPHQPFGGHKWSGVGTENGVWGYHSFTDLQVLHRAKA